MVVAVRFVLNKQAPSLLTLIAISMQAWIFLATARGGGDTSTALMSLLRLSIVCLVFDVYRDSLTTLIRVLMLHCEICVYGNFLTLLIAPEGLYSRSVSAYGVSQEWFLGVDNYFVQWLFPALVIAWVYNTYFTKEARGMVLSFVTLLTEFMHGSATGIVGVTLFFILMVVPKAGYFFTPIRSIVIASSVWLLIVIFRIVNIFAPIVLKLGKNLTFSGRLAIWDNAIIAISHNPVFGYGVLTNDEMVQYLGLSSNGLWTGATHCHNQILQIAFQGGLIALLLFLTVIVLILKKSINNWPSKQSQIASYAISAYIIMCTTEIFIFPVMFVIFPLMYLVLSREEKGAE
ncbi:O-antigen ligase domain-containing protein [Bifidobacterium tissieri]|uniref:O-antigen ligase domain-containing protein n=1 Tax=Bifidobacterium tissieri TaxID=1630162 RepID=A0A5M9ZHB6_9BIFI|nr:O-antigen ligase family protein [Bifidobacterium tissieri]KAA8827011.1 O-antigen ligase domain-containing protein [Bifidobacterium tissieri]